MCVLYLGSYTYFIGAKHEGSKNIRVHTCLARSYLRRGLTISQRRRSWAFLLWGFFWGSVGQNKTQSKELQQEKILPDRKKNITILTRRIYAVIQKLHPPEERSVQIAGVQMTLNAFLKALVQHPSIQTWHRRSVFIHSLTAPVSKCWNTHWPSSFQHTNTRKVILKDSSSHLWSCSDPLDWWASPAQEI